MAADFACAFVFDDEKLIGYRACSFVFLELSCHVRALRVRAEDCFPVAGLECRIAAERIFERLPAFRIGFAFLNGICKNLLCGFYFGGSTELCHCERAKAEFLVKRAPFGFCHGNFAFEKVDRLCERDFLVLYVDAVNFCKNFFVVVGGVELFAVVSMVISVVILYKILDNLK